MPTKTILAQMAKASAPGTLLAFADADSNTVIYEVLESGKLRKVESE